jgi:hypothetical protein
MNRNTRDIASRTVELRSERRGSATEIVHRQEYREGHGGAQCREHVGISVTEACCHEAGHTPPCTASAARITHDERGIVVTYRDRETKQRVERVGELSACVRVLDAFRMRNACLLLMSRIDALKSTRDDDTGRPACRVPVAAFYPADPATRRAKQADALRSGADALAELGEEIAANMLRARAAAVASGFSAVPSGLSFVIPDIAPDVADDDAPTIVRTVTS